MASKKYEKVNVRIYIVTWIREGSKKTIELSVLYALTSRVLFIHYAAFVVTFSCKKICWPIFLVFDRDYFPGRSSIIFFYAVSSVVSDLFTFSGVTRSPVPILCKEN